MAQIIKRPVYRRINTDDYTTELIQNYIRNAFAETTTYVDQQETKKAILTLSSEITLGFSAALHNLYLTFSQAQYDPFETYNITTGVFTAQTAAWHLIRFDVLFTTTGTQFRSVLGQINKSAITTGAGATEPATNYDDLLAFGTDNLLAGEKYIFLNKNDTFRTVVYNKDNTPATLVYDPDIIKSQLSFVW